MADEHTFFVGYVRVLLHNAACGPGRLTIANEQFGTRVGKHASDYGFGSSEPAARALLREYIQEVFSTPKEIRHGVWHPIACGGADYWFFRMYNDVVVTQNDGTCMAILHGGNTNGRYTGATRMWP